MCSFYSCMTFLWEDSGTSTHWPRVGKAWHQLVHIFFPMPANRLHFCNRKTSHGDQEATTWPAQTFTLWTPAQTLRHSLLSWGRSPSPTHSSIHSKPSWWWRLSQQLAGQGTFHTGVTYNVISWQKAADQVCLSHGFWSTLSSNGSCFLLKGVEKCILFSISTSFCIPVVKGTQVAAVMHGWYHARSLV